MPSWGEVALGRASGAENGPAVAQIAGFFATKSAEIKRCRRGLPHKDWHLFKFQSAISSGHFEVCSTRMAFAAGTFPTDRSATSPRQAEALERDATMVETGGHLARRSVPPATLVRLKPQRALTSRQDGTEDCNADFRATGHDTWVRA